MDQHFENRLRWHADRSLAGKYPKGEIAASTIYAREVLSLREVVYGRKRATLPDMTEPTPPPVLQWVTAPPATTVLEAFRHVGKYDSVIASLKERPNEWALVGDGFNGVPHSSAQHLKKKGLTVVTRTVPGAARDHKGNKLIAVYAAYVPPVEAE